MKIFSIKFVTKKVILIFGVRWLILLKNARVSPNELRDAQVCTGYMLQRAAVPVADGSCFSAFNRRLISYFK